MNLFVKLLTKLPPQAEGNKLDFLMHYLMSVVGGFLGAYTVINYFGLFPSAQTGNMIEMVGCLFGNDWAELALRLIAFVLYISALILALLLEERYGGSIAFAAIFLDAAAMIVLYLTPEDTNEIVALYPLFFATAFQWAVFKGAGGYVSATLFSTNNLRQAVTALTEYVRKREPKHREKAVFYLLTIFSYQLGVVLSFLACGSMGYHGIWIGLLPLGIALAVLAAGRAAQKAA